MDTGPDRLPKRPGDGIASRVAIARWILPLAIPGGVAWMLFEFGMDRLLPNSVWTGVFLVWGAAFVIVLACRHLLSTIFVPLDFVALFTLAALLLGLLAMALMVSTEPRLLDRSAPAMPSLSGAQVKVLRTLWHASAEWGADRMVVTYDGYLMPVGRSSDRVDLARELLGQRDGAEDTPVPEVVDLVTSMPSDYVRLIPIDGGFDVRVTLEITEAGRRYVESSP